MCKALVVGLDGDDTLLISLSPLYWVLQTFMCYIVTNILVSVPLYIVGDPYPFKNNTY